MCPSRRPNRVGDVRGVCCQLLQRGARGEHEHPGVPQMAARRWPGGRHAAWLFHKAGDGVGPLGVGQGGASLDVAVAGLRRGRAHAEVDDTAGARGSRGSGAERRVERRVGDRVVGREQPQHGVRRRLGHQHRRRSNRRRTLPTDRLQQDAGRGASRQREACSAILLQEPMLLVAQTMGGAKADAISVAGSQRSLSGAAYRGARSGQGCFGSSRARPARWGAGTAGAG